jgi:ACT domain-containing protein
MKNCFVSQELIAKAFSLQSKSDIFSIDLMSFLVFYEIRDFIFPTYTIDQSKHICVV